MARFCTQCGRPLAEGEVCTCTQQAAQAQQVNYGDTVVLGQAQQVDYGDTVVLDQAQQPYYQQNGAAQQYQQGTQQYANGQQAYQQGGAAQQYQQGTQQYANGQQVYQQNGAAQQFDANGQPIAGMPYGAPAQQQPNQAVIMLTQFGKDFVGVLKNPVQAISGIAARNNCFFGLMTVGIDAIVAFFVAVLMISSLNDTISSLLDSLYWGSDEIALPTLKLALIVLVAVIASYAAQAGVLLGMTKAFSKGNPISFWQALTYCGGKALYSAMVAIIVGLFSIFSIPFALVLLLVGSTLASLIGMMSYYQSVAVDGSKKVYALLVVYVAELIIVYLAGRLFVNEILALAGVSLKTLSSFLF